MNHDSSDHEVPRRPLRDLADLASSWNRPLDMLTHLKRLMAERPLLALGASVLLGAFLARRLGTVLPN